MTRRFLVLGFFLVTTAWALAAPRYYAPPSLLPGALGEVYVWDELPVGSFTVEVWRPQALRPMATAQGFAIDRPLPVKWSTALVALDALTAPGEVTIRILRPDGSLVAEIPSLVVERQFPSEDIALTPAMSLLRSKPDARKDKEAQEIWAVYRRFNPRFPWAGGNFGLPVAVTFPLSARFGDTRRYLYADGTTSRDYHRGTDFAVPVGTPVMAPAPGTVALVANRMLTGITVVLEHAPGVYSVYFHLSKTLVKKGQSVASGTRLALSGATGLITGPHLHWEVRVDGVPVDPLGLVTHGLLDTKVVATVISSSDLSIH